MSEREKVMDEIILMLASVPEVPKDGHRISISLQSLLKHFVMEAGESLVYGRTGEVVALLRFIYKLLYKNSAYQVDGLRRWILGLWNLVLDYENLRQVTEVKSSYGESKH